MFGVIFDGHPNLRADPHARGLRGPPAAPRLPDRRRAGALHLQRVAPPEVHGPMSDLTYREIEDSHELSHIEHEGEQELLTLNMGPHHPATHGVLRLLTTLEGEVVRDIVPMIGYVHTGIEKTAEDKAYWKVIPVVERMDYLAYFFNAMAFCGAVETLLELEVPRARPVAARAAHGAQPDHVPPGVARHQRARPRRDLDVLVLLPRPRADPRPVRDVDRPAHAHALHPGRRRDRGHPGRLRGEGARVLPSRCPTASTSSSTLLAKNEIVLHRLRGVAAVRRRDAARPRRHRPAAARVRQLVGPAQGRAVLQLRGLRLQDPGRHDRRQLGPLRRPRAGDEGVRRRSSCRRSTACPRARTSPRTASTRCRRGTSWRPRWRR